MLDAHSFFALTDFVHAGVFARTVRVWEALANLKPYMQGVTGSLPEDGQLVDGVPLVAPLVLH